ncbi:hypothetical protein BDV27DRAFT_167735 [Aspergillus caelatus]|uniref:Phosphoribosyltransferase domain-containing protein n=1 Tax=Aspergillus caelatus TaxID=61420 RepID=A0A5N6ZWD5_9EURO|nr:uncharacterized protein BDV27DRAFT_167735 [Aspergillus caelatus]KAE8360580.1 hypothetical protein BDV27DRAFT_167735 [Aspergillus caelatus]
MAQNLSSLVKPKVVGIYGIPRAGKTTLLNQLRMTLGEDDFMYFGGSDEIGKLVHGGITWFKKLDDRDRQDFRELAVGVATGHLIFWNEGEDSGSAVHTQSELDTYTHIIYLDTPPEEIVKRRLNDSGRDRSHVSKSHVQCWVEAEKRVLRDLCYRNNILFCAVSPSMIPKNVERLLSDFNEHDEQHNLFDALSVLDSIPAIQSGTLKVMIVLDANRTLTSQDTGALFWKKIIPRLEYANGGRPKTPAQVVFESPLAYTYNAFREVTLLHEERLHDHEYDSVCKAVALSVTMDEEFMTLLRRIAEQKHVAAVVVTCGMAQIWKYVLELEGLLDKVTVIGGGRISDGFVVAPELKEALVDHLKNQHHLGVLAFGDSPLDLKMLSRADKAFVNDGLKAKQCLRPNHVSPRLTTAILPELKLLDPHFVDSLLVDKLNPGAVKILMTPMRDMSVQGPRLSKAHRDVGWYLAATFLPELIGVEDIAIPHVQGHMATGHQLWGEDKILIVALMRALFVHASQPTDPQHDPLNDRFATILVDSVVNSGRTILDFDMQAECVSGGILTATLAEYTNLQFITLRISENKYKGTGATDTGNRLFNTLHLP